MGESGIRFIASDVDGTILPRGEKHIDPKLFEVIKAVTDQGVQFVIASGRPYCELKHLFEPVMDRISLVCSDGALTVYHGKNVLMRSMDHDVAEELLADVEAKPDCEFLVYGEFIAYMRPKEESYDMKVRETCFNHVNVINTFNHIGESDILKIGIYNKKGIHTVEDYFLEKWGDKFEVIYSANEWLEFAAKGVNKSLGLTALMEQFQIKREESIAFGDSFNDIGMFQTVGRGYAMKTAKQELKDIAYGISDNVAETVRDLLLK
ncbi:MAG: HAD family hydrolase [Lachnospiraceae bacterium]|nr:HAD family hydrolase [Lachnospiraceae bacterium]